MEINDKCNIVVVKFSSLGSFLFEQNCNDKSMFKNGIALVNIEGGKTGATPFEPLVEMDTFIKLEKDIICVAEASDQIKKIYKSLTQKMRLKNSGLVDATGCAF